MGIGPNAAIGTLFHRVLERAAKKSALSVEEIFDDEYFRAVARLSADPNQAHFAEISSTLSAGEWARRRSWVLKRARSIQPVFDSERTLDTPRATPMYGSEVPLESQALRLRGSADRIRRLGPGSVEVRDYKSGSVVDETGTIRRDIALQLLAYGLILLERRPGILVRLVVDDGSEREVPFGADAQAEAMEELRRITAGVPTGGVVDAESLASPGKACWGCTSRHVCLAYRRNAVRWWNEIPTHIERIPKDTWGTVTDMPEQRAVVLRDDAGRRVRISNLDERHGAFRIGMRVWFFGLEASGAVRSFDGTAFHPRSFHELPRDRAERRAWSLSVFSEGDRI